MTPLAPLIPAAAVPTTPLLAFGFGNWIMLGWLSAAAIPLIIHLWNKRKYREVSWAAVQFLMAAMRRNSRRIQIQQWLLLAVRTLLILLVVFAVAEPFLERVGLNFVAGQRTHKVLVIDGSYSMAYRPTDSSRFTRAKQLATQIVDESPQGYGFTLVLMSTPPRVIIGTPAFEPSGVIEEIESLALPHAGADLPATLSQVQDILQRAAADQAGLERHEVYFLTDLGRNSWSSESDRGLSAAEFRGQVEALAAQASLVVLDLGQQESENLAVTDFQAKHEFATTAQDAAFQAQIRNFGVQARTHHVVELLVDGTRVQETYVDVEPGGEATVSFSHRFEAAGPHVVQVKLGPDLLELDNSRYLALNVKSHLRVLLVSGSQGAASYLADALDPDRSEGSLVQPRIVPESALLETDLADYDCVFLCNVAQFTPGEARLLQSYLKQGGGLVFFLGNRVLPDRYNHELAGDDVRVLPARLGEIAAEGQYRFDPLDYAHPIIAPFRGRERAGLLTTPISRYVRLEIPADWTDSRKALGFAGGDPVIVEAPRFRGRSILVSIAASLTSVDPVTKTPWTTMPAWPSFLPIVQQLLAQAVGSEDARFNATVGDALGGTLPITAVDAEIAVTAPDQEKQTVRAKSESDHAQWASSATDESGVYSVEIGAPVSASEKFAVNVNPAESDLTKADPAEIPPLFTIQADWQNLDEPPSAQISRRSGLHQWLLYGALGLLFAEVYLAWRFGRGTA